MSAAVDGELVLTPEVRAILDKHGLTARVEVTTREGAAPLPQDLAALEHELAEVEHRLLHQRQLAVAGEVSAGVLHEARNLLTGVVGLSLMRSNEESHLDLLRNEAARCSKLLGAFLGSISRAPSYPADVDAAEVLNGVAALMTYEAKSRQCNLVVALPEVVPPLLTHANELQQVLLNLTINAIQASPSGGNVVLSVSPQGKDVSFRVSDEGPGIPESMLDQIFEPFFSRKTAATGTGLGLSTSRRLVERIGGRLTVANNPDNGTTFTVTIPQRAETPRSMPPGRLT